MPIDVTIVGYCLVSYINKSGKHVHGIRLYVSWPSSDIVGGAGYAEVWVSGDHSEPSLGQEVKLLYNQYRSVVGWL